MKSYTIVWDFDSYKSDGEFVSKTYEGILFICQSNKEQEISSKKQENKRETQENQRKVNKECILRRKKEYQSRNNQDRC